MECGILFRGGKYNIYTYTGRTLYTRFVSDASAYVWDDAAKELASDTVYVNSAIAMTEFDTVYSLTIPPTLPGGLYAVLTYEKAGASAAKTDSMLFGGLVHILVS